MGRVARATRRESSAASDVYKVQAIRRANTLDSSAGHKEVGGRGCGKKGGAEHRYL